MVLSDEQCMRFFDTMDALLYFVNERFRVVEGFTLDVAGPIDDMKAAIVARALWDNVEVIDDFVRENPARLDKPCLDLASSWKAALPGFYTLVRYQGGRALLMGEAGVFSVGGVTDELETQIGPAPAYVELVLLPFDDQIVYDGFLQAYSTSGVAGELQQIQDEFENRCAQGIISTGSEFREVAAAFLAKARDAELDALLAEVEREAARDDEVLPEGFHRGALAGLSEEERMKSIAEAASRVDSRSTIESSSIADHFKGKLADLSAPRDEKERQAEMALNCVLADVLARGVVPLDEAYAQYRSVVAEALPFEAFKSLVADEASYADAYFGMGEFKSQDYLMYYTLTPDYIVRQMSAQHDWRAMKEELAYYEEYRRGLLQARADVPAKPLSRTLVENDALDEVLRAPSIRQLRDFFDERVPDGEDDYVFAAQLAEDIAMISIETGSFDSVLAYLQERGVDRCTSDDRRYSALIANVFNAVPSWENNGWSSQELYEQLTGRKVFYNDDGSVMRVGAEEPCPCGSGLKYRECCGR